MIVDDDDFSPAIHDASAREALLPLLLRGAHVRQYFTAHARRQRPWHAGRLILKNGTEWFT